MAKITGSVCTNCRMELLRGTTVTRRRIETGHCVNLTRDLPRASITGSTGSPMDRADVKTTTLARNLPVASPVLLGANRALAPPPPRAQLAPEHFSG